MFSGICAGFRLILRWYHKKCKNPHRARSVPRSSGEATGASYALDECKIDLFKGFFIFPLSGCWQCPKHSPKPTPDSVEV